MLRRQLTINFLIFIGGVFGFVINRRNFLITLMCIELILLSINLNFLVGSAYLDDYYGQVFSIFILAIAAAESAIGIALIVIYYRLRSSILVGQVSVLRF
jgi:NADH-quinone oxidoreductase subunit K